jgi:hypothetical protein
VILVILAFVARLDHDEERLGVVAVVEDIHRDIREVVPSHRLEDLRDILDIHHIAVVVVVLLQWLLLHYQEQDIAREVDHLDYHSPNLHFHHYSTRMSLLPS